MNPNPTTIPGDAGSIADDNSALGVDRVGGYAPGDADALGVLRHLPRAEPREPDPDPARAEATVNEVLAALGLTKAATLAVARARSHSPGALGAVASLRLAGSIGADPELAGLRDDLGDAALAHVDAILAGAPSVPTPAVAESTRLAAALDADEELGQARRRLLELQAGIAGLLGEAAPPLHDPGANVALLSSIGFKLRAAEALAAEARGDLDLAREGRDKAQAALLALGWDYSTDSGEWLAGRLDALPRDLALVAAAAVHELRNALLPVSIAAARRQSTDAAVEPAADRGLAVADELARVLGGAAPDGAPYAAAHLRGWAASMEAEDDPAWAMEIAAARMLAAHVSGDRSARIPEALVLAEADRIRARDGSGDALVDHLTRQRAFGLRAFGTRQTVAGRLAHVRKEIAEIEASGGADPVEWIDLVLLGFDGALRVAGQTPASVAAVLRGKLARNEAREWPDPATFDPDGAVEHVAEAPAVG